MYKLIFLLEEETYFKGYDEKGDVLAVEDPLDAKRFTIEDHWHREIELNDTKRELENKGILVDVFKLSYSITR